ncbi:MAG: hypothetical protein GYA18_09370 [Chloroflexi bacterium]|nr:hypothetical protein [Chloroflexota bacterium]
MNDITQVLNLNQLVVLALPRSRARDTLSIVCDLALKDSLRVVDGGNLFNVLLLNRLIRRKTSNVTAVLSRIYISRAFTCFQMEAMLHDLQTYHSPVIVLDLLHMFYDESIDDQQSRHLFASCVAHLRRISGSSPVLVSIAPAPHTGSRTFLTSMLLEAANHVWQWEANSAPQLQPSLWED